MKREVHVMLIETFGTVINQREAMVEVLGDLLKLKKGNAVFAAKSRHFILEADDQIMQTSRECHILLYLRVIRAQYLQHMVKGRVKKVAQVLIGDDNVKSVAASAAEINY